jgi:hypothetical protein
MNQADLNTLRSHGTPGAKLQALDTRGWHLEIPAGAAAQYRCMQLDNYTGLARRRFRQKASFSLELRARVSAPALAGTWGFGLWNDPFSAGVLIQGSVARLPALPNAAWFFYASQPNHLALSDQHPADGFLAGVFRSPLIPTPLLLLAAPAAILLAWPAAARLLRRLAARVVRTDATRLPLDVTQWHDYRLEWQPEGVTFYVEEREVFQTALSPRGRLGLVIWIDNQYAAFGPDGRLRAGMLAQPEPAWLEVEFNPA